MRVPTRSAGCDLTVRWTEIRPFALCAGIWAPAFSAIKTTRKSSYLISVLAF